MHREDHQSSEDNNENERYSERSSYSPHYKRNTYNSGSRPSGGGGGSYSRDRDYNRDNPRNSGGYRPGGGGSGYSNHDRDYNRHDPRSSGASSGGYRPGGGSGSYNRDRDYNRDDPRSSGASSGGYRPGGGGGSYNHDRDYNRDDPRSSGGYRPGGGGGSYNRERDYNRDDPRGSGASSGGYRPGGRGGSYNRDRDYNRDDPRSSGASSGVYRPGGGGGSYTHDRDYNRDDPRSSGASSGGYRPVGGGYRPSGGSGYDRDRDHSRDEQRSGGGYRPGGGSGHRAGGAQRGGAYQQDERGTRGEQRQEVYRPRPRPKTIFIEDSQFLLPDHDLNQEFQRAIGMAKGTITEVDARKKRGSIEIDGHVYKFEDERKRDYQRKYPIEKFLDREIQFAFWPTYSQKAAQYRKIDESPTIKIANLRRTLPDPNFVEIIGEVMMVEAQLFVLSIFSKSQKKKYLVTIMGSIIAETGDLIQMFGKLKDGGIHYSSHRLIPVGEDAVAAKAIATKASAGTEA